MIQAGGAEEPGGRGEALKIKVKHLEIQVEQLKIMIIQKMMD